MKARKENKTGSAKPRVTTQQKKLRAQQLVMAVIGIVLVLSMVLALVMNY